MSLPLSFHTNLLQAHKRVSDAYKANHPSRGGIPRYFSLIGQQETDPGRQICVHACALICSERGEELIRTHPASLSTGAKRGERSNPLVGLGGLVESL